MSNNSGPPSNQRLDVDVAHPGSHAVFSRPGVLRLPSQSLFAGATEIEIEHLGQLYRLRQTASGKLILTK
jgi:hemin uptake protein HemP